MGVRYFVSVSKMAFIFLNKTIQVVWALLFKEVHSVDSSHTFENLRQLEH